jgi:aminoglycoside phosphotransferase (APT) family kinase protein
LPERAKKSLFFPLGTLFAFLIFGRSDGTASANREECAMSALPLRVDLSEFASRGSFVPSRVADPANPATVAAALRRYLGGEEIVYRESPQPICWGWETHVYRFQLERTPDLPMSLTGPLILRIYTSPEGVPRARHEFAVQQRLQQFGFPAPSPVHLETNCALFGGPFLLMEQVSGDTLFHAALTHPWRLWSLPVRVAYLHARLHELPAEGFAESGAGFLRRRLQELRTLIARYGLHGLQTGLDWLSLHRPPPWRPASLLHLDWHPLNLIHGEDGRIWVVDWCEADVGDPHADLATACVLARCAPAPSRRWWEKVLVPLSRNWICGRYGRAYRQLRGLDKQRLRYYQAWAVLRRLASYGRWRTAGPASTGSKADVLRYLQRGHLDRLCAAFQDWTGVAVSL